jgi:hypothetical protein
MKKLFILSTLAVFVLSAAQNSGIWIRKRIKTEAKPPEKKPLNLMIR